MSSTVNSEEEVGGSSISPENNNVLVIGDSHMSCTPYARQVHRCLKRQNMNPLLMARTSSTPSHWAQGNYRGLPAMCGYDENGNRMSPRSDQASWDIKRQIANHHADTLVLNLGDNLLGFAKQRNAAGIKSQFNGLLSQARQANPDMQCILISPTLPTRQGGGSYGKTQAHADFTRIQMQEVADQHNCQLIDGVAAMADRAQGSTSNHNRWLQNGDGVHLSTSDSQLFGERVCDQLDSVLQTENSLSPQSAPNTSTQ